MCSSTHTLSCSVRQISLTRASLCEDCALLALRLARREVYQGRRNAPPTVWERRCLCLRGGTAPPYGLRRAGAGARHHRARSQEPDGSLRGEWLLTLNYVKLRVLGCIQQYNCSSSDLLPTCVTYVEL